jgi:pyruvate/2-oxoglutarate dehydrogenase complex dihydrolipoamide acyltransferase (E2) component
MAKETTATKAAPTKTAAASKPAPTKPAAAKAPAAKPVPAEKAPEKTVEAPAASNTNGFNPNYEKFLGIAATIHNNLDDAKKCFEKGNSSAGARVRKVLKEIGVSLKELKIASLKKESK